MLHAILTHSLAWYAGTTLAQQCCSTNDQKLSAMLCLQLEGVGRLGDLLHESLLEQRMPLSAVPAAFTRRHRPAAHSMQQIEYMSVVSRSAAPKHERVVWWQKLHAKVAMAATMMWSTLALKVQWIRQPLLSSALLNPRVGYDGTLRIMNSSAASVYAGAVAVAAALSYAAMRLWAHV
jgi:hypothetical protein